MSLVKTGGDLLYEGEITQYSITPMTSTANLSAAQNRLSMSVNLRYSNTNNEEDDFEQRFSFFYDFPAEVQLYDIQNQAHEIIFERITQDIYNATLAKMVIMDAKRLNELIDQYDPLNKKIALEFLSISEEVSIFSITMFYHTKSLNNKVVIYANKT